MGNLLTDNAFGILGLPPNASLSNISRRGKEIERYLAIEETPSYACDFKFYADRRNEETVKYAVKELNNPYQKILHLFFRNSSSTAEEEEFLKKADNNPAISFVAASESRKLSEERKKNAAILLLLSVFSDKSMEKGLAGKYLLSSAGLFSEIINAQDFEKDFREYSQKTDEVGINGSIFIGSTDKIKKALLAIISDIFDITKDYSVFNETVKILGLERYTSNDIFVRGIYSELNDTQISLKSLRVNSARDLRFFQRYFDEICKNLNLLRELKVYESEDAVLARDKTAETLSAAAKKIYNFSKNEYEAIFRIFGFAKSIAEGKYAVDTVNNTEKDITYAILLNDFSNSIKSYKENKIDADTMLTECEDAFSFNRELYGKAEISEAVMVNVCKYAMKAKKEIVQLAREEGAKDDATDIKYFFRNCDFFGKKELLRKYNFILYLKNDLGNICRKGTGLILGAVGACALAYIISTLSDMLYEYYPH